MKAKHLLATAAVASVFVGCSQEELVNANNEMQALENRPMVEAPVIDLGISSRMTTNAQGNFASVKWQDGDGFGAAVMDNYNPDGNTWETMFPIQNHINSNVLFSYNSATGKFEADASMPMGNHLFYAPFNKANISRQPLAVAVPLTQVVAPVNGQAVSNSVVTAFYEDETTPVFFAYDVVNDEAKTSLSLSLNHIFALPHVTLDFGKVRLSDVMTDNDGDGVIESGEYVWESELTISKIVFTNTNKKIITAGTINNQKVINQLKKDDNGKYLWKENEFETNATAALLNEGEYHATSNKFGQVKDKAITVNFEGGMTISEAQDARFILILPGDEYSQDDLAIEVYATIDGEEYVLVNNLSEKKKEALPTERDLRLLPGYPYAADEYTAEGSPKASKGTSFLYVVEGPFAPVKTAVEAGYYEIETYDDLMTYIEDVAYRGEVLEEMTAEKALEAMKAGTYDRRKQFVITATAEAPIVIDEEIVKAFNNSCVITGKEAKINFLGGNGNLVLGDMAYDADAAEFIFAARAQVAGDVSLTGEANTDFPMGINLLSTATVDLTEDLTDAITVVNAANGTVNVDSKLAHDIWNDYGTLNVNVSTVASLHNGYTKDNEDIEDYIATMKVADNVTTSGAVVENRLTGVMEINDAVVTLKENNGKVTMNNRAGKLTVNSGTGSVNNTVGAKVEAKSNEVYAKVGSLNLGGYDKFAGLNTVYLNGVVSNDNATLSNGTNWAITKINFEEGSGINFASLTSATLDLSGIETIKINANVTWRGRDITTSTVKVKAGAIKEAEDCKLALDDINVVGYQTVATKDNFAEYAKAGGNVTLAEDVTLTEGLILEKDAVIDLNGKTLTTSTSGEADDIMIKSGNVTVKNGVVSSTGTAFFVPTGSKGNLTLIECNVSTSSSTWAAVSAKEGKLIIEGGEYNNVGTIESTDAGYVIGVKDNASAVINTKVNVNGTNGGAISVVNGATANITGGEYHAKEWHALNINGSTVNYSDGVVFTTVGGLKHVQVYANASTVNNETVAAGTQWDVQ